MEWTLFYSCLSGLRTNQYLSKKYATNVTNVSSLLMYIQAFSMYHVESLVENYWNALSISQQEADKYKLKAANESCNTGIPCAFTQTVVYETSPATAPDKLQGSVLRTHN